MDVGTARNSRVKTNDKRKRKGGLLGQTKPRARTKGTVTPMSANAANVKRQSALPKEADNRYQVKRVRRQKPSALVDAGKVIGLAPKQMDYSLLTVIMMLVLFGVVMVFSSSYYVALTKETFNGDMYYFFKRQFLWSIIGFCGMLFMANFDYRLLKKLAWPAYIVSLVLLGLVLVIGDETKGSRRWIFGIQPSEVLKVALIILMAKLISENKDKLKTFGGFLKLFLWVLIPVILIVVENLSTAIVVIFIGVVMLFIASPKIWYFVAMAVPIVLGGVVAIVGFEDFAYRFDRITAWRDPFSDPNNLGFQTVQSLFAVASGGWFGLGLGQSRQKLGFIPEAHNDIIFSIVCEELGFIGAAALLLLFMVLIYKGVRVALGAPDLFSSMLAAGIICMIGVQVLINISVITNTIPVTGMPLPFVSYGGTSLCITMGAMGILLNISRFVRD